MPITVKRDSAFTGVSPADKIKIFPGYREDEASFIKPSTAWDQCSDVFEVTYDTGVAIAATTVSTIKKLIDFAKGVLGIAPNLPSPSAIINGIGLTADTLESIIKTEQASLSAEFQLTAIPCSPSQTESKTPQCFYVRFLVTLAWQITDADPDDAAEFAGVSLTLIAKGIPDTVERWHAKRTDRPVDRTFILSVGPFMSAEPFSVYAKLSATVTTNGPFNPLANSASIIRIDVVKIILESTPCEGSGAVTPPPQQTQPPTPPQGKEK